MTGGSYYALFRCYLHLAVIFGHQKDTHLYDGRVVCGVSRRREEGGWLHDRVLAFSDFLLRTPTPHMHHGFVLAGVLVSHQAKHARLPLNLPLLAY
jgi:hypothetical protein